MCLIHHILVHQFNVLLIEEQQSTKYKEIEAMNAMATRFIFTNKVIDTKVILHYLQESYQYTNRKIRKLANITPIFLQQIIKLHAK
jgi:hypothetical protein